MKSLSRMRVRAAGLLLALGGAVMQAEADSIPSGFARPLIWRVGADMGAGWVPPSNAYLRGDNGGLQPIDSHFSGAVKAEFSFSPDSREGMIYPDVYQGIGLGINSFSASSLLGAPVSAYAYQGARICSLVPGVWLGYEWQFGAAFGWNGSEDPSSMSFKPVSTPVTAHMGLALKLHYQAAPRWRVALGLDVHHFSNGNTSFPNTGINSIGGSVGVVYDLSHYGNPVPADASLLADADTHGWSCDIIPYGAWRKRVVALGDPPEHSLCPGKFGVVGLLVAPMLRLNRWVAVGPALDLQWDEGAGLGPYWVEGSSGEEIKFVRPPFGKQMSAGVCAQAELTMPIFSVCAGMGYDVLCPEGDGRFFQSLTLKTFVTRHFFLNVGYRLANFREPQNLMLGIGFRLR